MKSWKVLWACLLALALMIALPALAGAEGSCRHDWRIVKEGEAPTCEGYGRTDELECRACFARTGGEPIPPRGHDFSIEISAELPATCTEKGATALKQCSRCGTQQGGEEIPALGHDFSIEVFEGVPATCLAPGIEAMMKCSRCGARQGGEPIPALGHDLSIELIRETPATCTEKGATALKRCARCQMPQGGEEIPALGHSWDEGEITTGATCMATGVKTYTCALNAGHTRTEDVAIDPEAHTWDEGEITTGATCMATGVKTYTCQNNSTHTRTEEIAALGHDWGEWKIVEEPTGSEKGRKMRVCARCDLKRYEDIPALGEEGAMPKTGVNTVPAYLLAAGVAISLVSYIALKRRALRK